MKYRILHDERSTDLQAAVQQALNEGWLLHGGVAVAQSELRFTDLNGYTTQELTRTWAQSMVQLEDKDRE